MIDLLIGSILALIMFSIGLSLRPQDFRGLYRSPRVLLLGLFLQLIFLPAYAFAVCTLTGLPAVFATGVLVLAACPGGLTSNFISYLLRANSALSVSLTICNSVLAMLTVPLVVNAALAWFAPGAGLAGLPFTATAGRIFLLVLLPVLGGMGYRTLRPSRARLLRPRLRWLSVGLLGLVFAIKLLAPPSAGGARLTLAEVGAMLPTALLVNAGALLAGRGFGKLLGLGRDDQLTLGVETGIQNTSLAFLITATLLSSEQMLKPSLVYAMFSFFTALAYGLWLKPAMTATLLRELRGVLGRRAAP